MSAITQSDGQATALFALVGWNAGTPGVASSYENSVGPRPDSSLGSLFAHGLHSAPQKLPTCGTYGAYTFTGAKESYVNAIPLR
jgi:hypothetical protein